MRVDTYPIKHKDRKRAKVYSMIVAIKTLHHTALFCVSFLRK